MVQNAVGIPAGGGSATSGMFEQALRMFGDSLKVAIKAQEDAVKFWSEAVGRARPGPTVAGEWVPTAQRSAEEYLRLLEASYRRNAELLKQVMRSSNGDEMVGMEKRTGDLLEASMATAEANAQDLASTTLGVAQAWTEVFKRDTQHATDFAHQVAQQTRRASSGGRGKAARGGS